MRNDFYPTNPDQGALVQSHVEGIDVTQAFGVKLELSGAQAAANSTAGVRAAVDNGATQEITSGFSDPPYPSNITVTYGGTAGDIKGGHQVYLEGLDMADEEISETLPAATANTAETLAGSKIFKKVTKAVIPPHDGTGATTALGWGNKKGLPFKAAHHLCLAAYLNGTREGTLPTMAASATVLASNSFALNSALAGTPVLLYLLRP